MELKLVILLVVVAATSFVDSTSGRTLGRDGKVAFSTPPMGWRNWNFFQGNITQATMMQQMKAMSDRVRPVVGRPGLSSLLDVGFTHAGLDDNWQRCHAGVHGPDSTIGSFHDVNGNPLINTTSFPNMKTMVDYGHSVGLKVGWYDNNCICGEGPSRLTPDQVTLDVLGNVRYVANMGFDGLKADGCGAGRNMTFLAENLRKIDRDILIENCHYNKIAPGSKMPPGAQPDHIGRIFPYWKNNITGGTLVCPEDSFRTSGDIRNSWSSWIGNLNSLKVYQDPKFPISSPGCWAYADMLMVGVMASDYAPHVGPPGAFVEWRSHFGGWAIASSPLILSFDLTNETTLESVWPFITNVHAIHINQNWFGHPGMQVFSNSTLQVWVKPSGNQSMAVLVINTSPQSIDFDLPVLLVSPTLPPTSSVFDIWTQQPIGNAHDGTVSIRSLGSHDSTFYVLNEPNIADF